MTYSLSLQGEHHCKNNQCYEQISGISGLLEEVLDGYIVFHDVQEADVKKAITYLVKRFRNDTIIVESEHTTGSYCELKYVCSIKI